MRSSFAIALALVTSLVACDTAAPPLAGPAFLTAQVDNVPFALALSADSGIAAASPASVVRLGGTSADGSTTLLITISQPPATGIYYFGCDQASSALLQVAPSASAPAGRHAVTGCLATGQVEVTSVDTTTKRIAGRFAFNAMDDADSLVHVRQGQFAGSYVQPLPSIR